MNTTSRTEFKPEGAGSNRSRVVRRMVWCDGDTGARNVFAVFRRRFRMASAPASLRVNLFAATRYRLRVNGRVAGLGPARFMLARPEHDTHDIAGFLRPGTNLITVEVNGFGCPTFEAEPSGAAFAAWSEDMPSLSTPGAWECRRCDAWDAWAPRWSFAQAPVEILDLAGLPRDWFDPDGADTGGWRAVRVVPVSENLAATAPRSIPPPSLELCEMTRVVTAARLEADEERIGFRLDFAWDADSGAGRRRVPCVVFIHSPRAQTVEAGLFWGPFFLNGEKVIPKCGHLPGNRQEYALRLAAGWNVLYGEPEVLRDSWGVLVGFPRSAGLRVAADPRDEAAGVMLRGEALPESLLKKLRPRAPSSVAEVFSPGSEWTRCRERIQGHLPAREMAWDKPAGALKLSDGAWRLPLLGAGSTLVLEARDEFIGHWLLDAEAPAGALIDIAVDERLDDRGFVPGFRDQFDINNADRLVWGGGRREVEGFRPRGGRFLQITVRPATTGAGGEVVIHRVAVRSRLADLRRTGAFACSDATLTWAWHAGARTIAASYEDAFVDPWRERGVYIGDTLVEHLATAALTSDASMTRRCLRNWAFARRPDGLLTDNAPSAHTKALADYSFVWVRLLRDYWAQSGDCETVVELWPTVMHVLEAPVWRERNDGLLESDGLDVFIDWAVRPEAKLAALNGFRLLALDAALELAKEFRLAGDRERVRRLRLRARRAFAALWDGRAGRFSLLPGRAAREGSLHVDILGLVARILKPADEKRLGARTAKALLRNHRMPPDRVELYFLHFALIALRACGKTEAAEMVMRNHYGLLRRRGATTLWETLAGGLRGSGSFCHGWAAAATWFLSREVLGVRRLKPGRHEVVVVEPLAHGLKWAAGVVPIPSGGVDVSWRVQAGRLLYKIKAPPGLRVRFAPRGRLARLPRVELGAGSSKRRRAGAA